MSEEDNHFDCMLHALDDI